MNDAALRDALAAAWPAADVEAAPGWLLRSTPAVARGRLNSALPLVPDPDPAPVEAFYAARGLAPAIQLAPRDGHPRLEAELDARGWVARRPALVLAAAADEAGLEAAGGDERRIALLAAPEPRWLEAWGAAEGRERDDVAAHARAVLSRLDGRAAYAFADGGAAVGLGVAEGELCALFCVATRPERRRRGLAAVVVGALGAWGRTRGARTVALEVEEGNAPALALYARLGFERRYAYVNRALMKSRYQSPERLTVRRCVA